MKELIRIVLFIFLLIGAFLPLHAQENRSAYSGVDATTQSHSLYYDAGNQNRQGTDEHKILADLAFFKWIHDEYGMQLDYFLMDAGVLDLPAPVSSPDQHTLYGSIASDHFTKSFPNRFKLLSELAKSFNCKLGIAVGADGFGSTTKDAQKRIITLVQLVRDENIELLKFDGTLGKLRADKKPYLLQAIERSRMSNPNLLFMNNGVSFDHDIAKYVAVNSWDGQESYTDVNDFNAITGLHHRLGSMDRATTPAMTRLIDDKGVCLSSSLDYWEDDLILQAFNRNTLFAPEIFGNPWLLKDVEYNRLANIFNMHSYYNDIMAKGKKLPEAIFGENAVSRGNDETRLITLRNLSWTTKKVQIQLDSSIGIKAEGTFMVKQLFPTERYMGRYTNSSDVEVEVAPFRSALILITLHSSKIDLRGCDYQIVQDVPGKPVTIKLLGMPGQKVKLTWGGSDLVLSKAFFGRRLKKDFFTKGLTFRFSGTKIRDPYERKLGDLNEFKISEPDASYIFEGVCFANDNNAPEIKSLERAGSSTFKDVTVARNAFFLDSAFEKLGLWDKYAFDGENNTSFKANRVLSSQGKESLGAFRLDFGKTEQVDELSFEGVNPEFSPTDVEVSTDLRIWKVLPVEKLGNVMKVNFSSGVSFRWLRIKKAPTQVSEIRAFYHGRQLGRTDWSASNLFKNYEEVAASQAFHYSFKIKKAAPNSVLALSVPGSYSKESVYAALMIDGHVVGPSDRSPAFPYNNWVSSGSGKGNYTFYFPLTKSMLKKKLQVTVISSDKNGPKLSPELWLNANPVPYEEKILTLQ